MNTMPLEADTRYLIDRSLENLGWNLTGDKKNVFFEQPKTEKEQQKLEGKRPDYVLYSQENKPLIIIEAKRRGSRIDSALEQGIYYANKLNAPLVFATDGLFCKSYHTLEHKTPLLNGEELDEFIRENLALKFLNQAEVNTVSPKVQYDRKELIKIFDNANNLLRGDGLRAGIERFGEFANILFIKLLTEKGDIDYSCSWEAIKNIPISTRIEYINSTVYKNLNRIYDSSSIDDKGIFTPLTMKDNYILSEIMDSLDPLTLTDVDSDVKGDAFEYFLKASTASGNDLGEYFTPRHIVKTMVRLVNPQIGEKVYDPFCGTGGFLIESFRHIWNNMPRNPETINMLKKNTIFGNEITNTARITKMNMILAGDGHSGIHQKDSLAQPINGKYDVVLANMPYSQKTKYGNLYDIPSKNGDSVCVQHCMKAINAASENGRMALVVPEGFLFRKDLKKTREYLLEHSELQSIISLPQGVFLPYTGVKTDIIYATKVNQKIPSSKKRKNYWYFDVKSDGYSLDNYRRKLDTPSDLTKYEEYRKLDETQQEDMLEVGFQVVPFDKVKENDFNFVGKYYKSLVSLDSSYPLIALKDILEYEQPTKYIVKNTEYKDTYSIPVLTPGKTFILGYTNEKEGIYNASKECPVIIFDDFTTSTKLVEFPFKVKSSAIKILYPKNNTINIRYIYYILQGLNFDNSIHKRYWIEEFSKLLIPYPPLEIQQQIVEELEGYEKIIGSAKKIIDNYSPVFKINTKWEKSKLGDLCQTTSGGTPLTSIQEYYYPKEIPWICSSDLNKGQIIQAEKFISKKGLNKSSAKIIPANSVLIAMYGATVGQIGFLHFDAAINQAVCAILPNEKYDSKFLYYLLKQYSSDLIKLSVGGAQPNISQLIIKDLSIYIPPLEEQKQIVAQIEAEQELINANKKLIEIFTKKFHDRINEIFEE